jgi:hypothetical protein
MRLHSSSAKPAELPNIKIKKHTKSPESSRFVTPETQNLIWKKLTNPSEEQLMFKSVDSTFRPGSIDLSSHNEKILDQTFTARVDLGEPTPVRRIVEKVPTLKYLNVIMSKDLAVMAQIRKSLIGEISNNKIPVLTQENLPAIRNSFCPKELRNIGDSLQLVQRNKAVSERKARHPYATGAYAIKALNGKTQLQIIEKLKMSLPEGSRFFKYL